VSQTTLDVLEAARGQPPETNLRAAWSRLLRATILIRALGDDRMVVHGTAVVDALGDGIQRLADKLGIDLMTPTPVAVPLEAGAQLYAEIEHDLLQVTVLISQVDPEDPSEGARALDLLEPLINALYAHRARELLV
jgi:hypothetical protein